ncbi:MAG: hypothetical protein AT710_02760 [Thermocladium sp. ECH_B]|jgi:hypothetical protein|nr:MAG: hypothetical protein AT710_02760 [Thermocladium sp. ECH_B]
MAYFIGRRSVESLFLFFVVFLVLIGLGRARVHSGFLRGDLAYSVGSAYLGDLYANFIPWLGVGDEDYEAVYLRHSIPLAGGLNDLHFHYVALINGLG